MGGETSLRRALAQDPALDGALRALLGEAIPWVVERNARLQPRLLLLMGSAAVGEASGVRCAGRILALSDLDLALFTERPGSADWKPATRIALTEVFGARVRALGLTDDPLDIGLFPLPFFARMPLTLELAEAIGHGARLWGETGCLDIRRGELPRTFEALRLLGNRVRETLLPPLGRGWLTFDPPSAPAWGAAPDAAAWHEAHRWGKLVLDGAKAFLAAEGDLEPSLRARCRWLGAAEEPGRGGEAAGAQAPAALQARLDPEALRQIERWTAWRLAPAWPPPPIELGAIARVGRAVLARTAAAGGIPDISLPSRATWLRLLSQEGGSARERLRSWSRLCRTRGPGDPREAGLRLAIGWGRRAWPVSLATLALAAAWLAAIDGADEDGAGAGDGDGDGHGYALRRWLRAEIPHCRGASRASWDDSWSEAFRRWFAWLAAAGV
ncbi:MAG: hypothetical protein KAY32_13045 [Candidatus Eisenbacteria sp.]|nr:hypothetical protein [Candidatus Eisenbacteria bacterium]